MTLLRYFYLAHATAALPATSKSIDLHLLKKRVSFEKKNTPKIELYFLWLLSQVNPKVEFAENEIPPN